MSWTPAVTVIVAVGALLVAVVGAQTFWICRALDTLSARLDRFEQKVEARLDWLGAGR
jgi:hypothetical protein